MTPEYRWRKGKPGYALMGLFSEMDGRLAGWIVRTNTGYYGYVVNHWSGRNERVHHAAVPLMRDVKRAVEAALEKRNAD